MTEATPATKNLWRTVRWPVIALATTVVLLLIGLMLDTSRPGPG